MGITAAFDDKQADFSRISQDPLMLTTVMQSVSWWCSLLGL
jgi:serine protease inhibitor